MELSGRMTVDMAIETGHAQAWMEAFAIIGRVELLLWKRRQQQPESVELDWGEDIFEQTVVIIDGDYFPARHVAEFRAVAQEDSRRKFREKRIGKVEIDINAL